MTTVRRRSRKSAQALIFFMLSCGLIFLLCGLAIDSGLLYLAKARLSRAVDGAALAAVGNASEGLNNVAQLMRGFAIANYTDLQTVNASATAVPGTYSTSTGATGTQYTYTFFDPAVPQKDATGNYRRYVQVILQTGAGGQITSALCNARTPVHTYFINIFGNFADLKVSSSAVATRNPRLIMVVVDRSASMLYAGGGAYELPAAITTFLNFFDTSSDYIGLVSFSSSARLEMPLTTNFLDAGTNDLYDTYQVDHNGAAIPGVDPEEYADFNNYQTNAVRRLKFGGQTAASEGMRMALEQLEQNPGFSNPNVVKYIVLFTDGAWNTTRTLFAAPSYTNVVTYTPTPAPQGGHDGITIDSNVYATYGSQITSLGITNHILPVPTLSPWLNYSNAITYVTPDLNNPLFDQDDHTNDLWLSTDGTTNEPLVGTHSMQEGGSVNGLIMGTNYLFTLPSGENPYGDGKALDVYTAYLNVWLPPGSVDYVMTNNAIRASYVSDYTHPTQTVGVVLNPNESNMLVVPGYIADGILCDVLDMPYPDNSYGSNPGYPRYRADNFNQPYMWPDDTTAVLGPTNPSDSTSRALMFRNYVNLLTGYYMFRPDDPLGAASDIEPLDATTPPTIRPLHGNGALYPSAGFYWPFDNVGVENGTDFALTNATSDPDPGDAGAARFVAYSENMLSTDAAPEYAGELFYQGTQGPDVISDATSVSTQITASSSWQNQLPSFATAYSAAMISESSHFPTNIGGAIWRPNSFNGSNDFITSSNAATTQATLKNVVDLSGSSTGGYVMDGQGNIYGNTMAYSGRPTWYYDFTRSRWAPIPNNHIYASGATEDFVLPLGNWMTQEYAWHARDKGITIYTVGYGGAVNAAECTILAQVANATNVISPGATPGTTTTNSRTFNANQPIGAQFYATTPGDISNDFYQVGTAINGALTQ